MSAVIYMIISIITVAALDERGHFFRLADIS